MKRSLILFPILFLAGCLPIPCLMLPSVNYVGMTREQVLESAIDIEMHNGEEELILYCYDTDKDIVILDTHGNELWTFQPDWWSPQTLEITQMSVLSPKEVEIIQHTHRWELHVRYIMAFYGVGYHYCIEIEFDSAGRVFKQRNKRVYFL